MFKEGDKVKLKKDKGPNMYVYTVYSNVLNGTKISFEGDFKINSYFPSEDYELYSDYLASLITFRPGDKVKYKNSKSNTVYTIKEINYNNEISLEESKLLYNPDLFEHISTDKQSLCTHPPKQVIVNTANGIRFKYCKACKYDMGDV